MPFELLHFRESQEIIARKGMTEEVHNMLEYLDSAINGAFPSQNLVKPSLKDYGWGDNLNILPDRKYQYKGFKGGIAVEGNLSVYEYIHEGLFRFQIGFDQKNIEVGILLINSLRSDKSPYESTKELVEAEIEMLEPTINLPVAVALFDIV